MRRRGRRGARAAAAVANAAKAEVEDLLEQPQFRVLTVDRMNWINPYTGELVPAPFDFRDAAREVLLRERPWEQGRQPMSQQRLHRVRWNHFLRNNVREDARLRYFHPDGHWLNPFTGKWVSDVKRVNGKIGLSTLEEMAAALAMCEAADEGGEMLSDEQLKVIFRDSLRAEAEVTARLQRTGTGSLTPSRAHPVVPSAGRTGASPVETAAFGWTELFGDQSPFDTTPVRNQIATNEVLDAHRMLTEAGIDWALHPGFDRGRRGCFTLLQATQNHQVCLMMGQVLNCGEQGADLVGRLRNELRYLCGKPIGFARLVEQLTEFVYDELGDGSPLAGFVALIDPADHSMDSLTMGTIPAVAMMRGEEMAAQRLGGSAPPMGSLPWDEYKKVINPSITQLQDSGTVFAMHQDGFLAKDGNGQPLGQDAVWRLVGQLANERPREVLSRVISMVAKHVGQPVKDALPHVGLWAMHVRS